MMSFKAKQAAVAEKAGARAVEALGLTGVVEILRARHPEAPGRCVMCGLPTGADIPSCMHFDCPQSSHLPAKVS